MLRLSCVRGLGRLSDGMSWSICLIRQARLTCLGRGRMDEAVTVREMRAAVVGGECWGMCRVAGQFGCPLSARRPFGKH
jgi:hypothetical protein